MLADQRRAFATLERQVQHLAVAAPVGVEPVTGLVLLALIRTPGGNDNGTLGPRAHEKRKVHALGIVLIRSLFAGMSRPCFCARDAP